MKPEMVPVSSDSTSSVPALKSQQSTAVSWYSGEDQEKRLQKWIVPMHFHCPNTSVCSPPGQNKVLAQSFRIHKDKPREALQLLRNCFISTIFKFSKTCSWVFSRNSEISLELFLVLLICAFACSFGLHLHKLCILPQPKIGSLQMLEA